MEVPDAPLATAQDLRAWFGEAIQRESHRPNMDLCAELAERINWHRPWIDEFYALVTGPAARTRKDVAEAVMHARHLRDFVQRRVPIGENPLVTRPNPDETFLVALNGWLELYSRLHHRETKSSWWIICHVNFTPHIVLTLHRAGWSKVSTTDKKSPVIAVLSNLIGAVTGGTPPNRASLGSTLRQAAARGRLGPLPDPFDWPQPKPEKKTARNNSSFSRP